MRLPQVVASIVLAACAVDAAPRGSTLAHWHAQSTGAPNSTEHRGSLESERRMIEQLLASFRRRRHKGAANSTTTTVTTTHTQTHTATVARHAQMTQALAAVQGAARVNGNVVCPSGTLFLSTTTVDITVYVTATGRPAAAPPLTGLEGEVKQETTRVTLTVTVSVGRPALPTAQAARLALGLSSSSLLTLAGPSAIPSWNDPARPLQTLATPMTAVETKQDRVRPSGAREWEFAAETLLSSLAVQTPLPSSPFLDIASILPALKRPESFVETPSSSSVDGSLASSVVFETELPSVPSPLPAFSEDAETAPARAHSLMDTDDETPRPCIDLNMRPVARSVPHRMPVRSLPDSAQIISGGDQPAGAPRKQSTYCGVGARPADGYLLAEFVEERPGVDVSEEGCYQFCGSAMESTEGCQSYRFYHTELGAPRCALYGMPVSWSVDELNPRAAGRWFDLSCGSPTVRGWQVA